VRAGPISANEFANSGVVESHFRGRNIGSKAIVVLFAPLQAGMAMPVALYLATLTIMLFRPPEVEFYSVDRIALLVLVFVVVLRALALRQPLRVTGWLLFPMAALTVLAGVSTLLHPYQTSAWSVMAAKFVVPLAMFWMATVTFRTESSLRWLERFCLAILVYLSFTAIMSLAGIGQLIFPRYILDESLGIHAERARGPFLQAVANGVTLNMLGLLAIEGYCRRQLRAIWWLALLPLSVAIVATKTRAVWLSFAVSVMWLLLRKRNVRLRSTWGLLAVAGIIGAIFVSNVGEASDSFEDRLRDRDSVEFRMAAYRAGWEMFSARPITGWGTTELQAGLADRIRGFRGESFAVHNTYLEILLEHGIFGIGLYGWLVVELFRLRKKRPGDLNGVASLRSVWPWLLCVYLVNAMFVVMNYPFVNGLLFTFAGILAAKADPVQWKGAGVHP
jgi:putative inorganic carbon (hco3(-)) transporter